MAQNDLDIVLPCYHPPKNWEMLLVKAKNALDSLLPEFHIHLILVIDGDENISAQQIQRLQLQIPALTYHRLPQNLGKGAAVRKGMMGSKAEIVLYTDIEFPYTYQSLANLVRHLQGQEADIVTGQRVAQPDVHIPPMRKLISKSFMAINRSFIHPKITDTQCGLKAMNSRGKAILMETTTRHYLFDMEFVLRTKQHAHIHIIPFPVQLSPRVSYSKVSVRVLLRESRNLGYILLKNAYSKYG